MKTPPKKDTIYIDSEDEITAIIDKVRGASSNVVALVLPKRNSTLQSIVNLKLLKRTGEQAKKNLVLITSDTNILPLAGSVGLHVAKTLQTKPIVPSPPKLNKSAITVEDNTKEKEITPPDEDEPIDPSTPVGLLAGQLATEETIELDNVSPLEETLPAKNPKKSKLKVPDFDKFRMLIFGGIGLLILLIVGGIFAFVILPKAKIVIKTDTTSVNTNLVITARADAKSVDKEKLIVPLLSKQLKKSDSEKIPTTGQRNDGTKASGTMTITNCSADVANFPAGTVFSSGSFNFLSNEAVSVPKSSYSITPSGFVCDNNGTKTVGVTAQNGGDTYNLGARSYQIGGSPTNVSAKGSDMKGGTTKIVQIVSQADIDNAKQKVIDKLTPATTSELKNLFSAENALPLGETLTPSTAAVTSTPNVNDPSNDVTVSVSITFSQLGVKQDDLKQLVEADVSKHIDTSKQVIQDNGINKAILRVVENKSANEVKFDLKTLAVAGPQLDGEGIKKQVAGKKKGDAIRIIQSRPGIKEVNISYSPFWVYSTPKQTSHITVIFEQNNAKP